MSVTENHDGHRNRMRAKLYDNGMESLSDVEVLETLLFHTIPRDDTKPLAIDLIEKFGTFSNVLKAPMKELLEINGVGNKTAQLLTSLPHFYRYFSVGLEQNRIRLFNLDVAIEHLKPKFFSKKFECVAVILLNSHAEILYEGIIYEGSVSQVPIYVRKIINLCIHYGADTVLLAHNHTSGSPVPSNGDVGATTELKLALNGIYVNLSDHLIFANDDYVSLKRSGWLKDVDKAIESYRRSTFNTAKVAEEELGAIKDEF